MASKDTGPRGNGSKSRHYKRRDIASSRSLSARGTAFVAPDVLEDALDLTEARRRVADAGPDDWIPWDETDSGR